MITAMFLSLLIATIRGCRESVELASWPSFSGATHSRLLLPGRIAWLAKVIKMGKESLGGAPMEEEASRRGEGHKQEGCQPGAHGNAQSASPLEHFLRRGWLTNCAAEQAPQLSLGSLGRSLTQRASRESVPVSVWPVQWQRRERANKLSPPVNGLLSARRAAQVPSLSGADQLRRIFSLKALRRMIQRASEIESN